MAITLKDLAQNPNILKFPITLHDGQFAILRPLEKSDAQKLGAFLESLSEPTRRFYNLDSFDLETAQQMCDDIAIYDKLRFIADLDGEVIGLFEFSMDIPESDLERFNSYGVELHQGTDCRFGPCISDKFQGTGLASMVFPNIVEIAKKFRQDRVILWGGVFADNIKALTFYKRNGFTETGHFKNEEGEECVDMILEY